MTMKWSISSIISNASYTTSHATRCAPQRITGAGDPGYEFTSKTVATVALCLGDPSCERRPGEGGVFTVGSAVKGKAIRERLEAVMVGDRNLMKFEKL